MTRRWLSERRAVLLVVIVHTAAVVLLASIGQATWGSAASVKAYNTLYAMDGLVLFLIDRLVAVLWVPPWFGVHVYIAISEIVCHTLIGGLFYAFVTVALNRLRRAWFGRLRTRFS